MEWFASGTPHEIISQADKPAARIEDESMGADLHFDAGGIASMAYCSETRGRVTSPDAPESNEETPFISHVTYSYHYPNQAVYC